MAGEALILQVMRCGEGLFMKHFFFFKPYALPQALYNSVIAVYQRGDDYVLPSRPRYTNDGIRCKVEVTSSLRCAVGE